MYYILRYFEIILLFLISICVRSIFLPLGAMIYFLHSVFQGTARRKKKVVHRTATADDKKLQSSLKKLAVNNIAGIEEVHQYKTFSVIST